MSQDNQFDAGPLTWVKGEIDVALNAARDRLAEIQAEPDRREPLRFAQTHVHQASGALAIVGLDGVSQYADAIDRLLSGLAASESAPPSATLDLAYRCIGMLGNYLNELVAGAPNHPLRLYPAYKELVVARGDEAPQPSELFFPDVSVRLPLGEASGPELQHAVQELRVVRGRFEKGLLAWLRKPLDPAGPEEMLKVVRQIEQLRVSPQTRAFWWVVIAFLEGLTDRSIAPDRSTQRLCRRIDAQLGRLLEGSQIVAERMMRDVLYVVATAKGGSSHARLVRQTYRLDQALPASEAELSDTLRQPIAIAVRETLEHAKEAWNRFCAGAAVALPQFQAQHAELRTRAAQLRIPQIERLLAASHALLAWLRADPLRMTDPLSMEMATALLVVEQATEFSNLDPTLLERQVDLLCAQFSARSRGETPPPLDDRPFGETTHRAQDRLFVNQLAREIQANLGQIEQTLDAFFRNPAQRTALSGLAGPLKQVQGAFSMLGETRAADVIAANAALIAGIAAQDAPPPQDTCNQIAHQLAAMGFFVDALRSGPARLDDFLRPASPNQETSAASIDTVEAQIKREARETQQLAEALRESPEDAFLRQALVTSLESIREDAQLIADSGLERTAKEALASLRSGETPEERVTVALAELAPASPPPSQEAARLMSASGEELDAELLAIFLEEAHEVLDTIARNRDLCAGQPHDQEALITVRRGFHTLKGSSRMVGLQDFSEAARHVEMTMNRWLQLERHADPQILRLVTAGHEVFVEWVAQLERGGTAWRDASALTKHAQDLLAALDAPVAYDEHPASAVEVPLEATLFDFDPFNVESAADGRFKASPAETRVHPEVLASLGLPAAFAEIDNTLAVTDLAGSLPLADQQYGELASSPATELSLAETEFDGDTLRALSAAFDNRQFPEPADSMSVEQDLLPISASPSPDRRAAGSAATDEPPHPDVIDLAATLVESNFNLAQFYPALASDNNPPLTEAGTVGTPQPPAAAEFDLAAMLSSSDLALKAIESSAAPSIPPLELDLPFEEEAAIDLSETVAESDFTLEHLIRESNLQHAAAADRAYAADAPAAIDLDLKVDESEFALSEPTEVDEMEVDLMSTNIGGYALLEPRKTPEDMPSDVAALDIEPISLPASMEHAAPLTAHAPALSSLPASLCVEVDDLVALEQASQLEEAEQAQAAAVLEGPSTAEVARPADGFDDGLEVVAIDDDEDEALGTVRPLVNFHDLVARQPDRAATPGAWESEADATSASATQGEADQEVMIGDQTLSRGLYRLYVVEARQHLDVLIDEHRRLTACPTCFPEIGAVRAAHTLAGISGTARIKPAHTLGKALEHALQRFTEAHRGPDALQMAVLDSSIATLDTMLAAVLSQHMPSDVPELIERLQTLSPQVLSKEDLPAGMPEADAVEAGNAPRDELDAQLLPIFFEEADELTASIGGALRDMRADPSATAPHQALARLLHTLKGSARMAGALVMGNYVHGMETRLDSALGSQDCDPAVVDELESGLDYVGSLLAALRRPLQEQADVENPPHATPSCVPDAGETPEPAGNAAVAPPAARPGAPLAVEDHQGAQGQRAALRVRAELVDRFVNEAGEIAIARTRIEGEMRTLRRSLLDLTENVIRLRNQLREVEIQAESQMQSRIAAAEARHSEFDPLEFDRFTRLQELTRMMAESVGDVTTIQQNLLRNIDSADFALHAQGRLSRDLQQALMSVRMVPFEDLADRLYRIVRQTAKELGKRASLDIQGGNIELDRGVLDRITAPIEHLLRNAVAHGIETTEARRAAGKPEQGQITLKLTQLSNEIALELSDDGTGLDYARILARGREKGLIEADEQPSHNRLTQLIFEPGFSTAESVSGVAGRGVGMDVVKNETLSVGGRIDVSSLAGRGTSFVIHLPLTLAVTQALLVRAGERTFAIPSTMVEQVLELKDQAFRDLLAIGHTEWKNTEYPYCYLPRLLGDQHSRPAHGRAYAVLLLRAGSQTLALHIDELLGNQEIVVKNAGPQFVRLPGFSGATVLPDGEISLILNPVILADYLAPGDARTGTGDTALAAEPQEYTPTRIPTIMVVDDSLTVRKITSRLLEREGFRVMTAKDGVDALEQLVDFKPDVMLLDIEMPRMDGFDLARTVRADNRLHDLPIIMITSRIGDKHRNYAMEIGVNHYLGKPYQEEQLLELITGFIAARPR